MPETAIDDGAAGVAKRLRVMAAHGDRELNVGLEEVLREADAPDTG